MSTVYVVYRGDVRHPDRTGPYHVPGFDPFTKDTARRFTDAEVKNTFARDSASDFAEFLFGTNGVYNANMPAPLFTVHKTRPSDVAVENEPAPEITTPDFVATPTKAELKAAKKADVAATTDSTATSPAKASKA